MSLPLAIADLIAKADEVTVVSDNARAPEKPLSISVNSPPLIRAAGWPRRQSCRRGISPPPRCPEICSDESIDTFTECRYDKPTSETLKLLDVYKPQKTVPRTADSMRNLGRSDRAHRFITANASRILSEALEIGDQ